MSTADTALASESRGTKLRALAAAAGRYGITAFAGFSMAGAHFIAALIFLRVLPPSEFGLISFAFVAVPPFLSVTMALLTASLLTTMYREKTVADVHLATHLKASQCLALAIAALLFLMMLGTGAGPLTAALFGVYGGAMSLRQFARSFSYLENRRIVGAFSDLTYSTVFLVGLGVLFVTHQVSPVVIAALLAASAIVAFIPFGRDYLTRQFTAGLTGWFATYRNTFRDLARWSLLGVVSTELTVNAHAYLVTLIAGPHAFAVLAAGALFLRPVSLVLTILPEMERPVMARGLIAGDSRAAFRVVNTSRLLIGSVLVVTMALAATVLVWFPDVVLKGRYPVAEVAIVAALWAAIMAVRTFRTPSSVFLQAATEFKPLALASVVSGIVSVILTLALLILWGPIASLAGILLGEVVLMGCINLLVHRWKARHG